MVWVALRPEKVRITREKPSPGLENCVGGTVAELGYLGGVSIYKLRIRDDAPVRAAVANVGGNFERPIGIDEQVWLSWPDDAAIVLTR